MGNLMAFTCEQALAYLTINSSFTGDLDAPLLNLNYRNKNNQLMKYCSLLFAFLFMVSCHSQQKPSESQPKAQDSTQVEQLELPPLEAGEVEYKDESMFGDGSSSIGSRRGRI